MRCPKCGYITFDHLETCTKCKKNIASAAEQLSGTTFQAEAPSFLQFEVHAASAENDGSVDVFSDEDDIELDMSVEGPGGDVEFDFEEKSEDVPDVASFEEDDFDLPLTDDDIGLDLEGGAGETGDDDKGPQLDFSELDISDLAPPADTDELPAGELTLDESGAASGGDSSAAPAMAGSRGALEDLQMEGLDLGIPSAALTGSDAGGAIKPGVKTGTALDDFDIDLGELTSGQEK